MQKKPILTVFAGPNGQARARLPQSIPCLNIMSMLTRSNVSVTAPNWRQQRLPRTPVSICSPKKRALLSRRFCPQTGIST